MDDPLLEQLLADAESLLSEFGLSNAQAADRALGADSLDLEVDREDRLRAALITELDRRHGGDRGDPDAVTWAAEEWSDRGVIEGEEDR